MQMVVFLCEKQPELEPCSRWEKPVVPLSY
jgi:hypothetical protein